MRVFGVMLKLRGSGGVMPGFQFSRAFPVALFEWGIDVFWCVPMLESLKPFVVAALFCVLTLLLLSSSHHNGVLLVYVSLQRVGRLRGVVVGVAELVRSNVEVRKMDGMIRGVYLVVLRIFSKKKGTEATWIILGGSFIPSLAKVGIADGDGCDISGIAKSTEPFVELDVFSNLGDMNGGVNRVVEVSQ